MTQYLLSIYQPDGPPPPPEQLGTVMQNMATLTEEARNAGVWVLGGLHPAEMATVVRHSRAGKIVTDGPFIEGKEHLGGFWIIEAPDLDIALEWAGRLARVLTLDGPDAPAAGLPVEVRPIQRSGQDG